MQPTRRSVLVGTGTLLAGCGRSLRENSVPGGLELTNRRKSPVTVEVRASRRAGVPDGSIGSSQTSITSATTTLETPESVESPDVAGEYEVPAGDQRAVPDFFPEPGRWVVEVVVADQTARTRIELVASIPGPAGIDTVLVSAHPGGRVSAEATQVD